MFTLTIAVNGTGNFWRRIREKFFKEQEISRQTWNSTPGTPGPFWEADTISRWIEEERHVQVFVRDNNVDQALKVLKKKMQREGVFREMKLRSHYEKPSERKTREKAEAIRRARKLARKKMQREGLLPMKPRVIPGAAGAGRGGAGAGAGGPPRGPRR